MEDIRFGKKRIYHKYDKTKEGVFRVSRCKWVVRASIMIRSKVLKVVSISIHPNEKEAIAVFDKLASLPYVERKEFNDKNKPKYD